jgi:putative sigma-54 modulation protein
MKIRIDTRNVVASEALRVHVERRLGFAFGRFGTRIARVIVRISETNGHRSGANKRCRIEVDLRPARAVQVEDTDASVYAAFDHAADRASRSIARMIEREHEFIAPRPSRAPMRTHAARHA